MTNDNAIDTGNYQGVSVGGNNYIYVLIPKRQMTKAEALVHAAWLVALADETEDHADFTAVLKAVENT